LARKNLGGPAGAADLSGAASDAGAASARPNRNGAVSIHFDFTISSAQLELLAIEIN
jgi:hypothetical protein